MMVRLRGHAAGRDFAVDGTTIQRDELKLVVRTDDGHTAELRPRWVGSVIGSDDVQGRTLCNFVWDGKFICLAFFDENAEGDILITPEDY